MSDEDLAKDLGLLSALTIGIGTMIGAGIFVLPGVAAQEAGPIVVISFIIGGLIAMVNALAVAELGTAMPKAGGAYYWINRALGPLFGSIAGLGDWMGLAFASAFYSLGFGGYLANLIPLPSLLFLTDVQVGALIAGLLFVGVNYIGAKETSGVQSAIVLTLLAILTVFAIAGIFTFDYGTLIGEGGIAPFGSGAILPGTALVFVSYLGYAKIGTVAEELKNPGRNLPIAVLGSVGIVTVIYTILMVIMLGIITWADLDQNTPVSQTAEIAFAGNIGAIGITIMTLGALLATASSANASILSSARINFAMGRDKIVTNWLNDVHSKYATPYRSILVTGAIIITFIAIGTVETLAKAASVLHLIVYALTNVALIVFRRADLPEYEPDFTVPLYPVTPIVGAILSIGLIAFMDLIEIALSLVFVVVAVSWYFIYARKYTERQGLLGEFILDQAEELPDVAASAASKVQPEPVSEDRVMVSLANPRTEQSLLTMASIIAKYRGVTLHAVHIVEVPDQTSLHAVTKHLDQLDTRAETLLDRVKKGTETYDVPVETHTIASHRSVEEVFDAAQTLEADIAIMGWTSENFWRSGRISGAFDELARDLPCDFLVLKDRGLDADRVLVPTAGGSGSDLSGEIAKVFRDVFGSEVTLLHVVANEDEREEGEKFLESWRADHGLADAELQIDSSGDIEGTINQASADYSLIIIGATELGLLSRLRRGSLAYDVVDEVDSTVVLAERPSKRSLRERILGRDQRQKDPSQGPENTN